MNNSKKKTYLSPVLRSIEIGSQQLLNDSSEGRYDPPKNIYKDYYEEHSQSF